MNNIHLPSGATMLDNFVVYYKTDFLNSEDIELYFNREEDLPPLKKDGAYFVYDRFMEQLSEVSPTYIVNDYIEDIPEYLYENWQSQSPGKRTGRALVRFSGKWFIAVRKELYTPGVNSYGTFCRHSSSCRLSQLLSLQHNELLADCYILYSDMSEEPSWPPKKERIWCLFIWDDCDEYELLEYAWSVVGRTPCEINPEKCGIFNELDQTTRTHDVE